MIHQLRIYEIFEHNKQAFHERFRDHAARIMRTYSFQIVAMWETRFENKTEFVYLLEWPDEATKTRQWAAFMAPAGTPADIIYRLYKEIASILHTPEMRDRLAAEGVAELPRVAVVVAVREQ